MRGDKLNHAESKFHAEVVVPSGKVWDSTSPRSSSLIAHDGAEVQWDWVKIQDSQA